MVRFSYVLIVAVIIALATGSCREKGGKYINEGEIHYKIDYAGPTGMPKELLPRNLIVSFQKDKILFEMTGIGNSGIQNLANPEKDIYDTYFTLFDNKYYYQAQAGELFPGFEAMNDVRIKKTSRTSVICGFNCKNAQVTIPSYSNKAFDIWYTDEIRVENPNVSTPFNRIEGVLMSFFFLMGPVELHFNAETVYKKDIPENKFERQEKFIRVTKENIIDFINTVISI